MYRRSWLTGMLFCALLAALPGCGRTRVDADTDSEDLLAELEGLDAPAAKNGGDAPPPAAPAALISVPWIVGDRYPLEKTVFQKITQGGQPAGHERLQVLLSLAVDEVQGNRARFAVRYHKVRLQRDVGGQTCDYDSSIGGPPPPAALAYAGMLDDGFSFWMEADRRVGEVVGFSEFLQRCVKRTPALQQPQVLTQLASLQTGHGIASFIDDSLGMLPAANDPGGLRIGTAWPMAPRKFDGPAPMVEQAQCVVKQLTLQTAELNVSGKIVPGAATSTPAGAMSVVVREGLLTGQCRVDRLTGLPTQSHLERNFGVLVTLPDGTQVSQEKQVVTALTSFPVESAGIVQAGVVEPAIGYGSAGVGVQPALHSEHGPPSRPLP